jgi:hypothetical protein
MPSFGSTALTPPPLVRRGPTTSSKYAAWSFRGET